MTFGSLFTGIGGLDLALEAQGMECAWQCDNDPHALAVLAHHWPKVHRYTDVRNVDETATRVDVVCGGFPCQPHSLAGKRKGTADSRWLWPEFARVIEAVKPRAVFIENVPGLRTSGLRNVLADLARLGFDAEWDYFSAQEVGAPHRRRRLFILAYANGESSGNEPRRPGWTDWSVAPLAGNDGGEGDVAHPDGERELQPGGSVGNLGGSGSVAHQERPRWVGSPSGGRVAGVCSRPSSPALSASASVLPPSLARVGRMAYGVPARAHRLRLIGNAVVPQQASLAWRYLTGRVAA